MLGQLGKRVQANSGHHAARNLSNPELWPTENTEDTERGITNA